MCAQTLCAHKMRVSERTLTRKTLFAHARVYGVCVLLCVCVEFTIYAGIVVCVCVCVCVSMQRIHTIETSVG